MSRTRRRLAPSHIALVAAAVVGASPAMAATTTVTVPANTTETSAIEASPAAGDTVIVDVDGTLRSFSATDFENVVIYGSGAGAVDIVADGRLQGSLSFSSATGPISVTINSGDDAETQGWHTGDLTTFGSGADTINNTAAGTIAIHGTVRIFDEANDGVTTINFGGGADSFNNAGRLIVGRLAHNTYAIRSETTLRLTNLETFNNSGLIVLGSVFSESGQDGDISDGQANDRLIANGVAFTGSGESRIALDVYLDATVKADCSAAGIADCVDFTGGSTAGSTLLTIRNAPATSFIPDLGAGRFNSGVTLVVGSSAASHFSLDPSMSGYVDTGSGGALEVGLVRYQLAYDATGKRHMLVSTLPSTAGAQAAVLSGASQEIWHATAGSWFTRQADLRDTPGGLESSNGFWGRISTDISERDARVAASNGADVGNYLLETRQRTTQLAFGGDMLRGGGEDSAWVVGLTLGVLRADVDYQSNDIELIYTGFTGGVYGSYVAGPLFVDALFNANLLDVEAEVPSIGLRDWDKLNSEIRSIGGQIEAGWRIPVGASLSLEPLVGVSYVSTKLDEVEAGAGVHYAFEDAKSLRASAGLRGAYQTRMMGLPTNFSLSGRYWKENEDENEARLAMTGGEAILTDELPGSFTELDAALNLFSGDGGLSGFINIGGKLGDDYQSVGGSAGVRLRW